MSRTVPEGENGTYVGDDGYDDNDDRKVEALATDCEVGDLTRAATPTVSAPGIWIGFIHLIT